MPETEKDPPPAPAFLGGQGGFGAAPEDTPPPARNPNEGGFGAASDNEEKE